MAEIDFSALRSKFANKKVCVIGDLMLDRYLHGSVRRISPEAPIPILNFEESVEKSGGAANVALNVLGLGATVDLISICGNDEEGLKCRALLEDEEIGNLYLHASDDRPTTLKTRVLSRNQQLLRVDRESEEYLSSEEEDEMLRILAKCAWASYDLLIVQDYNKGLLSKNIIQAINSYTEEHSLMQVVDPKLKNFELYNSASLITPNRKEALDLMGGMDLRDGRGLKLITKNLLDFSDSESCALTLGEDGIFYNSVEESIHREAIPVEIADVCGAGDAVLAVLAMGKASGIPMRDALELAVLAGAIVCRHHGVYAVKLEELAEEYKGV